MGDDDNGMDELNIIFNPNIEDRCTSPRYYCFCDGLIIYSQWCAYHKNVYYYCYKCKGLYKHDKSQCAIDLNKELR